MAAVAVRASARERICAPRTLADYLAAWADRLAAWAVKVSAWERICTPCTLAACAKTFRLQRKSNVFEQTAKVHDVQIRSQADTLTAQAARRLAQAARRSARVRGAQIRSGLARGPPQRRNAEILLFWILAVLILAFVNICFFLKVLPF